MNENRQPTVSKYETKKLYPDGTVKETYHEQVIRGTRYRVNSVYQGKFTLEKAIEDLTVRKVLRTIENGTIE